MLQSISPETRLLVAMLISFIISVLLRKPVFNLAIRKGLYENVNGRSSHHNKVPNVGGIMIFIAFIVSLLLFVHLSWEELKLILLSATIIFAIGLYDDILVISVKKKLIGEIVSASVLIIGGIYFTSFNGLFGLYTIPMWLGVPFTLFVMVGIMNAINFIDGIDGLCSIISSLIISAFSIWFYKNGYYEYAITGFIIVAAIIPFLYDNFIHQKNKIFMGDNGSLLLGTISAIFIVKFCNLNVGENIWFETPSASGVAFCIMSIPVMDALRVIVIRISKKLSPFSPDKCHIHHDIMLIYKGNHHKSTFTIFGMQLMFILLGFFGSHLSNGALISLSILLYTIIILIISILKTGLKQNL